MRNALATIAAGALALSGVHPASAATPASGLQVYVEEWNPTQANGETLKTLESNPTLLSDTLNSAWGSFRSWYLATLPEMLHRQNYLHSVVPSIPTGISLYSRTHDFAKAPELTLAAQPDFKLTPQGANGFQASFRVPASGISLCATQPTVAGKYADPCATLTLDVVLNLSIKVSDTPGHTLQVVNATVSTANFQYNNENLSAQVIEALSDVLHFFGGPDYQALLVKTVDSQKQNVTAFLQAPIDKLNTALGNYEQTALNDVNQLLKPAASFDRLIHIAVWAQNSANSQMLTLLFAPPTSGVILDPARQSGQASGTLTFDASVKTLPTSCAQLNGRPQFTAQAQTGPRPVVAMTSGGAPVFGTAPSQPLSLAFSGGALQGRQCPYTVSHLALGLPNTLNFNNYQIKATGQAQFTTLLEIQPSQWSSPVVLGANGAVISTGAAAGQAQGMRTSIANPLQGAATAPLQGATPPPAPGPGLASAPAMSPTGVSPAGAAAPNWNTSNRALTSDRTMTPERTATSAARQSLNLVASSQASYQPGEGALPRAAQVGAVSPVDPALNQAKTTTWGSTPAAAPTTSWGQTSRGTSTMGGVSTLGGTSTLGASSTLRSAQPVQQAVQQPTAIHTAPSSLGP